MFTITNCLAEFEKIRRQNGIFKFDVRLMPGTDGLRGFSLCVRQERHYVLRSLPGQPLVLPREFKPCDGSCTRSAGEFIDIPSDKNVQLQMGFLVRLPKDWVLISGDDRLCTEDRYHPGGSLFTPETIKAGKILKNGESIQVERCLRPGNRINLTPAAYRIDGFFYRQHEKVVDVITDTVTNINGHPMVTNNEAELRAQAVAIEVEVKAALEKAEQERKNRGKDYAKEVGKFLREECRFTYEQVGKLFEIAGPGQCRDAVCEARQRMAEMQKAAEGKDLELHDYDGLDFDLMDYAYRSHERKDWRRIHAGADYIVSIGGVPADKKK